VTWAILAQLLVGTLLLAWLYLALDALWPSFPTRLLRWWRGQPPP
jgi:hypothetical protein